MHTQGNKRKNRVGRYFLLTLCLLIVALVCCIVMLFRINSLQGQLDQLRSQQMQQVDNTVKAPAATGDPLTLTASPTENTAPTETTAPDTAAPETQAPSTETAAPAEEAGGERSDDDGTRRAEEGEKTYVYLTFDDGPSDNTERILEILRQNNIKATFFVNGRTSEADIARYKAIANDGHVIAMHSYSHDYKEVYSSVGAFDADLEKIQSLIKETTGQDSVLYRFPGGSSNRLSSRSLPMKDFVAELEARGIRYFDWNVDSTDGSGTNLPVSTLVEGVARDLGKYVYNVVLMHDAGDHDTTVEALPQIIQLCKDKNMEFKSITADTPVVHHMLSD